MISMLLAYDASGNIIATQDSMVAKDADGQVIGLIDFEAHEAAGGKLRDIWNSDRAVGSGTWPEWIGGRAHDFKVELDAAKRITALVHKTSGHRRERTAIEAAIEASPPNEKGERDIRHVVGGPTRPLVLDDTGRTVGRSKAGGTPKHLPLIGRPLDPRVAGR